MLYLIDSAIKGYEYGAYKLLMMESKRKVPKNNFDFNISVNNEYDAKKLKKKLDDLINTKKTIDDYMLDIINSISLVLVDVIEYDVYKKFYNFVDQDLKQKIYVKACKTK